MPDSNLLWIVKLVRWPVVALSLGFVFLLFFRSRIASLFDRLRKAKLPRNSVVEFDEIPSTGSDRPEPVDSPDSTDPHAQSTLQTDIDWDKSGDLYWLGHDLIGLSTSCF